MTTTLLLARHGATELNLRRPYVLQGRGIDLPLCDHGLLQAAALAKALGGLPVAAVYSSPLARARQTAAAVAERNGLTAQVVDAITEADIARWEGLTWEAARKEWPAEVAAFEADPETTAYLGGESFGDVSDRAVPALERLAAAHPGEVVVAVSHNVVNRAAIGRWLGIPMSSARRLPSDNCGFSRVEFADGRAKVRTVNVAEHLCGLLPLE